MIAKANVMENSIFFRPKHTHIPIPVELVFSLHIYSWEGCMINHWHCVYAALALVHYAYGVTVSASECVFRLSWGD